MLKLIGGGLEIANNGRERFSKAHNWNDAAQSGIYTVSLVGTFPLDQSIIWLPGRGIALAYGYDALIASAYLSDPQTVSIPYIAIGRSAASPAGLFGEVIKLARKPKSIEVISGGANSVTLTKALTDPTKAIIICTLICENYAGNGNAYRGAYPKIYDANTVKFYEYDGTTLMVPAATYRWYVIQP